MINAENRSLIYTQDMFGDEVKNEHFAVFKHNKADIFLIVKSLLGHGDVDNGLLLKLMRTYFGLDCVGLVLSGKLNCLYESLLQSDEDHDFEVVVIV